MQKQKKKDRDGRIKGMEYEQNVEKDSSALDKSRISLSGYLFFANRIKSEFNINGDSFDFTKLSKREKTVKIISYLKKFHDSKLNVTGYSYFFPCYPFSYATVIFVRNSIFIVFPEHKEFLCRNTITIEEEQIF